MALYLLLGFGVLLLLAPVGLGIAGITIGAMATVAMLVAGGLLTFVTAALLMFMKLWVKAPADMAYVRTGRGKAEVITNGGALFISFLHELVKVSLRTIKLDVQRHGGNKALVTKDMLRADVSAEFYVKVNPNETSILQAARSFGNAMESAQGVKSIVEDKLVSALRAVALKMNFDDLNADRDTFVNEVEKIVKGELEHNGLTLESVTISMLDQTDPRTLDMNNVIDAQGIRRITQITQEQETIKNQAEKDNAVARQRKDVQARKEELSLAQERAEAEADQAARIAERQARAKSEQEKAEAEARREAEQKRIETEEAIQTADIAKTKALEVATRKQQEAIEVAEEQKRQAVEVAAQERQKAAELAAQRREQEVADAEREKAAIEAQRAKAQAEQEREEQNIETIKVTEAAERAKKQAVIDASAKAEREYIEAQRSADAKAYEMKANAEGRKAAADADAEATIKKANASADAVRAEAQAQADAATARATGLRAEQMVPVEVKNAEVNVKERQVEVDRKALQAKTEFGKAALDFELAKVQIEQDAQVRIETARANATILHHADVQVFTTLEEVQKMQANFARGLSAGKVVEGFLNGANEETREALGKVAEAAGEAIQRVLPGSGGNGEAKAE